MIELLHSERSGVRNKVGLAAPVWLLGKVHLDPPSCKNLLNHRHSCRDDLGMCLTG